MRTSKLFKRPKGRDGEGRQVRIKHILIPEEVADELDLYKGAYASVLGCRVTYEQMFRRWLANIKRIDADIPAAAEAIRQSRKKDSLTGLSGGSETEATTAPISVSETAPETAYDPADPEMEPWNLRYVFEKDGEEIEAKLGDQAAFYATVNGRNVGMATMLYQGWRLMNEVGYVLDIEQAWRVNKVIRQKAKDI